MLTERQRTVAELLAIGKSQSAAANATGVAQPQISEWLNKKPEFASYVARLSQEVMEAAIRAAAHNVADGVNELCRVRVGMAKRIGVHGEDGELHRDANLFDIKEHRETTKAIADLAMATQRNAREREAHDVSMRAERVALAAALAAAQANNIPTDPDSEAKP